MGERHTRRRYLAALAGAGAAGLAGCTGIRSGERPRGPGAEGGGSAATPTTDSAGGRPPLADAALPLPDSPAALREHVKSGGPGKDGIPSIDQPSFVAPDEVGIVSGDDPVFGVVVDGEARAYPQIILVWHEIVNDTIAGEPLTVTYCPLTGTAMGFRRGGTTFGVSGRLLNNNLVMYDRETDSRWPQVAATAISGPHEGRSLDEVRVVWTTLDRWVDAHPDTRLLSTQTGFARDYGRDPYGTYDPVGGYYDERYTLFDRLNPDERLHPKRVVVGARTPEGAVAFEKRALREAEVMTGDLGSTPVVAVHEPGLDAGYVYRRPERTTVEAGDGAVLVDGTAHPADDLPLDPVLATDAMWFAWSGFYPDLTLYA
jgi:hypothetical protein